MIYSTTPSLEGFEIVRYVGIARCLIIGYPELNGQDPISSLYENAQEQLNESFNAIIDIKFQTSGTFTSDDDDNKWPDLIIYGTAVQVRKRK